MNYIDYYPPVLKEVYEIKIISEIMDSVLGSLAEDREALIRELYIYTAADVGLSIWENVLSIKVSDKSDLETRRVNILAALLKNTPSLIESLNALLGEGNYSAEYYPDEFLLSVTLELTVHSYLSAVKTLLEAIVPLNVSIESILLYRAYNRLYFGSATVSEMTVKYNKCGESGVEDFTWLTDENGCTLTDENGSVLYEGDSL
ncbi:MAG: DUF2313 domain-containing protein [Clostridiales bacterium]|nr:DUF2313 domain-containing protein [Clostridiales bacterium]